MKSRRILRVAILNFFRIRDETRECKLTLTELQFRKIRLRRVSIRVYPIEVGASRR